MKRALRSIIRKMPAHGKCAVKGGSKRGSYMTEAAISMPVLILCVCAMVLVIRIASVCEGIWFAESGEIMEAGLEAYDKKINVSLCKRVEKHVLSSERPLTDFSAENCRYLYSRGGIDDLISVDGRAVFRVVNAVGIDGKIEFDAKIMARAFTGTLRDASPLAESEFKERGVAEEVWVFPKYGIRFHGENCRYVKIYDEEGSYKLKMDKREAELKGYTPCLVCGGAADA